MLNTIIAVHLVLQQAEGLTTYLAKVLLHKRDAGMTHLRHPVCHIADDSNIFWNTQSLTSDCLKGRNGQKAMRSDDGIRWLRQGQQLQCVSESRIEADMMTLHQFCPNGKSPLTQRFQVAVLTIHRLLKMIRSTKEGNATGTVVDKAFCGLTG